jgi:hypothetical protein
MNYHAASSGVSSGVMFHSPQAAGNTTRRDLKILPTVVQMNTDKIQDKNLYEI